MDKYLKFVQFIESLINNPGPNYLKEDSKKDRTFFINRLKYLLNLLGNPQNNFKYIHIAGTSGKSSLACMLQSILTQYGLKTGAYFSPHPTETFERIKVGHHYISPTDFAKLTKELKPYLSKCAKQSPYGIPSYFETLLTLAFLYFKKQKCRYFVLEAGLGGAFDATNVIPKPEIAIITNINLDHTDILGNTKQKIARDKAGIVKKGTTLITAEQDPKILKIFANICKQKNAKFYPVKLSSKSSPFNRVIPNYKILKNNLTGTKFIYQLKRLTRQFIGGKRKPSSSSMFHQFIGETYQTRLPGEHQIKNAILAIEAIKKIRPSNLQAFRQGLRKAFLPCRLELVQRHPTVILDGAHNPDKMKSTAEFIKGLMVKPQIYSGDSKDTSPTTSHRQFIGDGSLHLILALAENKDLYNTLKHIVPLAHHTYLTRFLIPGRKSQDLKKMYQCAKKLTKHNVTIHIDPYQALNQSLHKAKKNDIVLITGSFFLAGELRKKWISEKKYFPQINSPSETNNKNSISQI